MPKLNKLLVMSIIADIKECVYVANEIYSWVGGIEHLSWKFPTKIARDVNAMEIVKEHNGTAGEFYILLLELAYDRIQFVLRLIVEFMDKYPFVDDFFKEVTCSSRSNQISLASLIRLVWDRLKTLPESISRHMVKNSKDTAHDCFPSKVSRSTQAGGSINYCESCSIAGDAVLQTINRIEHAFAENELISVAVAQRNECRNDIYERTQWAVMSKLTDGIANDIDKALNAMRNGNRKADAIKQDYEKSIRELQSNLATQKKRLDAKNLELEDTLENVRQELELTKLNNVILEEENKTLKETLEETRKQACDLADGNSVLQSQTATLVESKLELEKTVIELRKEVTDARDACLDMEQRSQALLSESTKENNLIKDEHRKEIEDLQQVIASLRSTIQCENEKKMKKKKEKKKETKDNNSSDNSSVEREAEKILTPEVDPVADMTRQLISNREKIELLSRQNERLSKTLQRLREHRLTGQISANSSNK